MIQKKLVIFMIMLCSLVFAGAAYAADEPSVPVLPAIYKGTVVDQNGQRVTSGTIRAYIDDELKGEVDFSDGTYKKLLVQADMTDENKPVEFKVVVKGAELEAQSQPDPVLWRSGKISGLDIEPIKLTVDLTKIPPLVTPVSNKPSGSYSGSVTVELSCGTAGAKIYYTTDGSDPKSSSSRMEYAGAITISETTTIKAVAERGGEYSDIKTLNYTISMSRIQVEITSSSITLKVGATKQLTVDTEPSGVSLDYETSNSSVATVSSSGKITAKSEGTAIITVTGTKSGMHSDSDSVTVTVLEKPVEITVEPENVSLKAGETQQLTVETQPSSAVVTYWSSNTAIAKVTSTGLIIAVARGTATITIDAVKDDYDDTSATVRVTVTDSLLPVPDFTDLSANHWAVETINYLAQRSIIGGYQDGSFNPNSNITRAEFTKILAKALTLGDEVPAQSNFKDVASGAWYFGSIEAAAKAGLIMGDETGTFRPNDKITRQEMAIILIRAMDETQIAQSNVGQATGFTDDKAIASWARGFVVTAVKDGLVSGYPEDNTFRPANNATRAEACAMIYRLMEQKGLL